MSIFLHFCIHHCSLARYQSLQYLIFCVWMSVFHWIWSCIDKFKTKSVDAHRTSPIFFVTYFRFVIGEMYHVIIQQLKVGSKYWYRITINSRLKTYIENHNPQSFSNVYLYTSEPFWDSFTNEFGKVCNFKVLQDAGEFF